MANQTRHSDKVLVAQFLYGADIMLTKLALILNIHTRYTVTPPSNRSWS